MKKTDELNKLTTTLNQPQNCMFRSRVAQHPRARDERQCRSEIHDHSASGSAVGVPGGDREGCLSAHGDGGLFRDEEHAGCVYVEEVLEFGEGESGDVGGGLGADLMGMGKRERLGVSL